MDANTLDFFAGQQSANLSWQRHTERLQARLNKAETDFANAESGRIGFAHLAKMLTDELHRVDPANSLVQRETQLRLLGEKVAEKASELGYVYDSQHGRIVGRK